MEGGWHVQGAGTGRHIVKLNKKLKKEGELSQDDFEEVNYKKLELDPNRKPPVIKKW